MRDRLQGAHRAQASLTHAHNRTALPLPSLLAFLRVTHRSQTSPPTRASLPPRRPVTVAERHEKSVAETTQDGRRRHVDNDRNCSTCNDRRTWPTLHDK